MLSEHTFTLQLFRNWGEDTVWKASIAFHSSQPHPEHVPYISKPITLIVSWTAPSAGSSSSKGAQADCVSRGMLAVHRLTHGITSGT